MPPRARERGDQFDDSPWLRLERRQRRRPWRALDEVRRHRCRAPDALVETPVDDGRGGGDPNGLDVPVLEDGGGNKRDGRQHDGNCLRIGERYRLLDYS